MSFAAKIDVSLQTLYNWEKEHADFLESAEKAKEHCRLWWDSRLVESASGVTTKETTEATDANGNKVITTVEKGKVNNGSVQFALTNYFKKDYNNRSEVENVGAVPVRIVGVQGFTGWDKPVDEKESE
jgi:DNA-binding XRE family transcriptional regulator